MDAVFRIKITAQGKGYGYIISAESAGASPFLGFRRKAPCSSLFPHMLNLVTGQGLSVFRAAMLSDDHYQSWLVRVAAGCPRSRLG
jgi:hypothetical protein